MAAQGTHDQPNVCPSKIAMRSVLALGLLITLCAPANATTARRSKPHERHLSRDQDVTVPKKLRGSGLDRRRDPHMAELPASVWLTPPPPLA